MASLGCYTLLWTIFVTYVKACSFEIEETRCHYNVICHENIDEFIDMSMFRHISYMDEYQDAFNNNLCNRFVTYEEDTYYPVNLVITSNSDYYYYNDSIPRYAYDNEDRIFTNIIYSLDLSRIGYRYIPNIKSMQNLAILNISNNQLTTAMLSNENNLNALSEIDFSHNNISDIKVNNYIYPYKKLTYIDMSHNTLIKITDSIFDTFESLKSLDLSYNYIETLNKLTFKGLIKLVNLNLSSNNLTNINGSLSGFKHLIGLNLSNNKIKELRQNDFNSLESLVTLDLSSNSIQNINEDTFITMTELEHLDLGNNLLKFLYKTSFYNSRSLKNIDLSKNQLESLPKGLFENTTIFNFSIIKNKLKGSLDRGVFERIYVTKLDLSDQFITKINDYAFFDLFSLETLLLNSNSIESLSNMCFKTLKSLQYLDLSYNQITKIDFDKGDLIKLNFLLLNNNRLTVIKGEHLSTFKNLKHLDISENQISQIEPGSFISLSNVLVFVMSNNTLGGTLKSDTFKGLILLPSLDLSGNILNTVQNASFNDMRGLKLLDLSSCEISEIEYNVFIHTGQLKILNLSHNKLTIFLVNTTELLELHTLLLNDNLIQFIAPNILSRIAHLKEITLFRNSINLLNPEGMTFIVFLDLTFNNISKLQIGDFNGMIELKSLDLSFNKIMYIQPGVFKENSHLTFLNISHNYLSVISYGIFRGLTKLNVLNMSYNNIEDLKSERLYELQNLEELIVDYNQIAMVDTQYFVNSRVRILSIGDNILTCETLIELSKNVNLNVTAITLDEHNNENLHGVTCNKKRVTEPPVLIATIRQKNNDIVAVPKFSYDINKEIGSEDAKNPYLEKIVSLLENSNVIYEDKLSAINNNTNLLIQLLKQTLAVTKLPFIRNYFKSDLTFSDDPFINNTKSELENDLVNEKFHIINDTENKSVSKNGSEPNTNIKVEKVLTEKIYTTLTIVETCEVLIILILIGLILYKICKYRMYIKYKINKCSTRHLPDNMENYIL